MKPIHTLSDEEFADLVRRAGTLEDAPESAVTGAINLWRARQASGIATIARAAAGRLVAALTFDSWAPSTLAFGVRNLPSETRQLLFSTDGRDVDVRVTPGSGGYTVSGQILGPDLAGSIELVRIDGAGPTPSPGTVTNLDDDGEFYLDAVGPGTYTVVLRLPDAEIELPAFEVGERHR